MESLLIFVIGAGGGLSVGIVVYLALCILTALRLQPDEHSSAEGKPQLPAEKYRRAFGSGTDAAGSG